MLVPETMWLSMVHAVSIHDLCFPLFIKGKETTVDMVLMIADSQLRKWDKDKGVCDNPYTTPSPKQKSNSLDKSFKGKSEKL